MKKRAALVCLLFLCVRCATAQSQSPPAYQVVLYSATTPSGVIPSVYPYSGGNCTIGVSCNFSASNFKGTDTISDLTVTLNSSIATALSVIPVASPASGVITKTDPVTGAELPVDYTLGPVFTERAETIGRHKFYIGLSNQDFHFTSLNGQSLKAITMMDVGRQITNLQVGGPPVLTPTTTLNIGMDVRIAQNLAFLTYGLTSRLDVSLGLPLVHAAVSARGSNELVYSGNGFANAVGTQYNNVNCWCAGTLTPGIDPLGRPGGAGPVLNPSGLVGLVMPNINDAATAHSGFGDMLIRVKGTAIERRNFAVALGADLRLPTGDERNFLGTGATAIKPFVALSLYTTPLPHGIVFAPHVNLGWQYSGESILGGLAKPTPLGVSTGGFGAPFTPTKDFLPDVFSWAVGTEVALGRRNTVVLDVLGNEIGWVHGIPSLMPASVPNVPLPAADFCSGNPCGPTNGHPQLVTAVGNVPAGRVSYGQYSGSIGYKAKIAGNLVGTFNMLLRLDHNGLTDRAVPLFGLGYTF
ncbi:MAG TPA: transporter [Terriglobales bacterium]|nr:transporter [Terriglobales bacterium]